MSNSILSDVLKLAGGKIAGRVRFQKTIFLLDHSGVETGFNFEYHHYGPYSEDLSSSIYWAEAEGEIAECFAYRSTDGVRYSVFELKEEIGEPDSVGGVPAEKVKALIEKFDGVNATVLELAATALWLKEDEEIKEWEPELKVRKGQKVTPDRIAKAKSLLLSCGFDV